MGANAQTTVPTFTAAQVLTAAQMNQSARTGVPVFANTTDRDAAFGGAGEKTLAEGQLCYLEDANIVQYYDGASWATVGPSTPGLVLISSTTIGSAVTSVSLTNVFSSTYTNYKIIISGGAASATSDGSFYLGGDNVSGYYNAFVYNGWPSTGVTGAASSNTGNSSTTWAYSANGYNLDLTIFQPNAAARTSWVTLSSTMATTGNRWAGGGFINNATQYTGLTFQTQSSHTLTGGTIKVYGFRD